MCRRNTWTKNLATLKGKTTRTMLPAELLEQHKNVTLAIDMMYVNRTIPFMIMTSCTIHFGMAEMIKKWKNLPSFHSNK